MAGQRVILLCVAACLIVSRLSAIGGEKERSGFAVGETLADGWLLEYAPSPSIPATIRIDEQPHLLFEGMPQWSVRADHTGDPLLPADVVTLGIPPDATVSVALIDPVYDVSGNQLVAPYPRFVKNSEDWLVPEYVKDPASYARNTSFPEQPLVVDAPTVLRDQHIVSIRISRYRYNPATKILQRLVRAKLDVRLRTGDGRPMAPPSLAPFPADPFFEDTYKNVVLNHEEAKAWRRPFDTPSRLPADSTRDWFETGKYYYKIPITENGWYKVTKEQLVAAGANPSLIDIPTLKMFFRGAQIPIVVRPDTSIEFYGRRNNGDSTYVDFFTDTSAYWLTWGGAAGLRFTPLSVDSTAGMQDVGRSIVSRHFEKNDYYYQGTGDAEIINMETVHGEGWAWGRIGEGGWFFPNFTHEYPFTLDHLDTTAIQATIRIRVVSVTPNFATPNHHVRFWINDVADGIAAEQLGEFTFAGRTSIVYSLNFPRSVLLADTNVLKMQSIPTNATTNLFYLDWFEINYPRLLRPEAADQLAFTVPAPAGLTRARFLASGFTTPSMEVFELATRAQLTGASILPDEGGFAIAFRDSFSTARSYVVVAAGGVRPVVSVTQKMFTDIRVNAAGADYLIVVHRDFFAAAQKLALHRQAFNGVRTAVIDVQDIYDEFNYGILNATKVKVFLRHAYDNWTPPRPSSLVLFGDASWDYHGFNANTVNTNFVPSYGVPSSDNWFVCFRPDTTAMPSMHVGRLPVRTPDEALSLVQKIIGYDTYTLADWNKKFLFVAGNTFGTSSNNLINNKVTPPPIGGTVYRAYKTTPGALNGEHKAFMKQVIREGILYLNFIGHSGGRIWEVDIGPAGELENTNGRLPFVSSVSCNVGAFADPVSFVLAEDFILAENRAAVGVWASSTLGYPSPYGVTLQGDFLQGVRDSVRGFGELTTLAKVKMLRLFGLGNISLSTVNCNNLLGDPLSQLALPTKPELVVHEEDIMPDNLAPSVNDTLVTVNVRVYNFGTVTGDSVEVTVADTYAGQTTNLVTEKKLPPMRISDSLSVAWRATHQVGPHVLSVSVDPQNRIPEVSELNNIASRNQYVYANLLSIVKPIRHMVVPPGVQRLVATSPIGIDSAGFTYEFELDTVDSFDSPMLVASGPVPPTLVTGEWLTPPLANNTVYFWRARTRYGGTLGNWVESAFSTSSDVPALPTVRWSAFSAKQFRKDRLTQATATDTGVTIAPQPPINVYVRSVGNRYQELTDFYSTILINDLKIIGYVNDAGRSFIAGRINDFTGAVELRSFNVAVVPAQAQEMADFLNQTPAGSYVAWSAIFDPRTNVTESLLVAMERYGSVHARTVQPGESWAFVGRQGIGGPGMAPLEVLNNDTAVITLQILNYYGAGNGSVTTRPMFIPNSWGNFQWQQSGVPATNTRIGFLGVRPTGATDTLRIYPKDSLDIDLSFLNNLTSGSRYQGLQVAAFLSTTDALVTPSLRSWRMDVNAPADLAINARTIGGDAPASSRNVEVTVYNIGFQDSDSSTVVLSVYDRQNRARPLTSIAVPPIALGSSHTATIAISTANLPRRATLQATVIPAKRAKDLVLENNTAYHSFDVLPTAAAADVRVYADGSQIMDGDYVPPEPRLLLQLPNQDEPPARTEVRLYVNERYVESWSSSGKGEESPAFSPRLPDGNHQLRFSISTRNTFGEADSMERLLSVNVSRESRFLHVFNYPNPFSHDTHFTFTLAGSVPAEQLVIRIFTVAGRKIKEIVVPPGSLRVGFNRVHWDGRDEDGDDVANGYYFYHILMKGEGREQSEIQRLVRVR